MFEALHRADRTRRSGVSLRALRLIVPVTAGVLALALHGAAVAPAAPVTLFANVGPQEQIGLTDASGAPVTQLPAGAYTIVVTDQTPDHNFHLTGPGVNMTTTVSFQGQVTWNLTLVAGSYHFQCDPHADAMFGNFTVVAADTTPPDTTITAGPTGSVNTTTANFSFSSNETGATFECALDAAAFAACTTPKSYTALAAGQHNFQVRAIDAAGNVDATPAARAWTIDTTPPDTTITAGPTGTVGSTSASFSFTSPDATATFQCSLDSTTAYSACTSPKSYTGLAGGAHTFRVRAVDPAGNLDASPASRAWTIDATPPDTTITVAPAGTVASGDAGFEFVSTEAGSTFQCSLDGAAFAACSSPASYFGLADGAHTFQVRAIDTAGNVDATPAAANWTIDTTPPETTIVSGPAALVRSGTATFSFSSSEANSSFECSLDGAAFAACSSPQSYSALADGAHTFDVRATDAAGNLDASPANAGWTVDTTAPDTTIDSGPADTVGSKSASFGFSSSEAGSSFQCALDGAAFAACSSPKSYTGLADGPHSFQVRSIDLAGNPDASAASRNWSIDSTALYGTVGPGFTITLTNAAGTPVTQLNPGSYRMVVHDLSTAHNFHLSGPGVDMSTAVTFTGEVIWTVTLSNGSYKFQCDPHVGMEGTFTVGTPDTTPPDTTITSGPSGSVASAAASFGFSSSEPGSSFQCALDGAAFSACSSPVSYNALADGAHSFQVRATDAAGNTDASPASRSWTIDTTPPETTITGGPTGTVTSTSASFDFSASEAGATFACSLDGAVFAACTSPKSYSGLAAGTHTFQVRAADALGNADATPASRSWTVQAPDTTAPDTTITSGPSGSVASAAASFGFSSSEPGSSFQCALDGAAFSACSSPVSYSALADGAHSFQVRATDAAGNTDASPASRSWTIDTTAPETTITAGPSGTVTSTSASFDFSASEAGATFACSLDGAPFSGCTSPQSYSGLAGGTHTFQVRAADALGNADATPASRSWTVQAPDTTAPETTIGSGPSGSVASGAASFSFSSSEAGSSFQCALDAAAFTACNSPASYTALADGAHNFQVRAIDAAGNVDATPAARSWTIDTTPPDTTITAGPSGTVTSTSASFDFTASEAGATFACALDGAAFSACTSPRSYTGLAGGAHTFQVRAADALGNADATPASRTWTVQAADTTPPETTISSGPAALVNVSSASFAFSASEAGATFACSLDGAAFMACSSPTSYSGLADGSHSFQVRATDAAGNTDATPAARSWTVDTVAPDTTVTAGPSGTVTSTSASFSFSSSEAGSSYQCALDGGAYAACASPKSYTGLAAGTHTFQVRAVDAAGNADATPAASTWTVEAATTPNTLYAQVSDESIWLKDSSGNLVSHLDPGTYTIVVRDLSDDENFRLRGPGVDRETSEDGTGTVTWTITFVSGEYEYRSDHDDDLRGEFSVGSGEAPAGESLNAQVSDESIWLKDSSGNLVSRLDPGTYTIVVGDLSDKQNFHLRGSGVDRETSESGTGTVTWTVTFVSGEYEYRSDEESDLKREFYVGSGAHDD